MVAQECLVAAVLGLAALILVVAVAPAMASDCTTCHTAGGIAPDGSQHPVPPPPAWDTTDGICTICHEITDSPWYQLPPHGAYPINGSVFPHVEIWDEGIPCIDCHGGQVIHGRLFSYTTGGYTGWRDAGPIDIAAVAADEGCAGCHTSGMAYPTDPVAPAYTVQIDLVTHGDTTLAHAGIPEAECATCHGSNVEALHPDCLTCHTATPPAGARCSTCHDDLGPNHGDTSATHDSVAEAACVSCHGSSVVMIHESCATCHPPYAALAGYTCSTCHADLPEFHGTGSRWSYNDAFDGLRKSEGGYSCLTCHGPSGPVNPHGGYDTTSNKCTVCHAVHRATGAFYLTRVDSPDDACSYCHIGDHRHATSQAYGNDPAGIYARNGHTIGSGKAIPDSTVYQWMDAESPLVAKGDDLAGDNVDAAIQVRAYDEAKNKVFKWSVNYEGDFVRSGPTFLTCMSCHQPHNAEELVWKPLGAPNGYKLLRANPSGSVADQTAMANYEELVVPAVSDIALKAVSTELSSATTGWAITGYTTWRGSGDNAVIPVTAGMLSVWCANCHNLNIGAAMEVPGNWRSKSHVDRTHPVPLVSPDVVDCIDCHGGQSADASDFPHSGSPSSTKLLGADINVLEDPDDPDSWNPNNKTIDGICLRCHDTGIAY